VESKPLEKKLADKNCPQCGQPLLIKRSRYGEFLGCSGFPQCKYTESLNQKTGITCPQCEQGEIIVRKTKKGKNVLLAVLIGLNAILPAGTNQLMKGVLNATPC